MPNNYGFNILGDTVACIDCDERGPASAWPARTQARHQAAHVKAAKEKAERDARRRAREARRLAEQARRENDLAYGEAS